MTEIKIDKNVTAPLPVKRHSYPYEALKVGESFFVPWDEASSTPGASVRVGAAKFAQTHPGTKLTCRTITENNVRGVRVWRIS